MIVDAFLYNGEVEMLELRVFTLAEHVDLFMPVVCSLTHQGLPTDLDAATRLPTLVGIGWEYKPKVHRPYVMRPARGFPRVERSVAGSPWFQLIERQHRAGIWYACNELGLAPTDIVLVSDVDEIPNPDVIPSVMAGGEVQVFEQRFHSDKLTLLHPQQPWYGTTVSNWRDCNPHDARQHRAEMAETPGATIPHGGWHFSWFGTDEQREAKLHAFSHGEIVGHYDPKLGREHGIHSNGEVLRHINLADYDWPKPMLTDTFDIPKEWL